MPRHCGVSCGTVAPGAAMHTHKICRPRHPCFFFDWALVTYTWLYPIWHSNSPASQPHCSMQIHFPDLYKPHQPCYTAVCPRLLYPAKYLPPQVKHPIPFSHAPVYRWTPSHARKYHFLLTLAAKLHILYRYWGSTGTSRRLLTL